METSVLVSGPVLVTGASGFLGSHLARQLRASGRTVRVLVRRAVPELAALGCEVIRGDLRDRAAVIAACAGIETVFHAAAITGIWGAWSEFYAVNTQGTEHVLAGCRAHEVPRLVYTSSPSVTFAGTDQAGCNESIPYPSRWNCPYPWSKALAEQAVLAANGNSLRTCALRPHLIWGPGDEHLVPRLWERARSGKLRRVGEGTNRVDMIYIDNAVAAHLLAEAALDQGRAVGKAYFLSQGEPVNCWDWIDQLLALKGLGPIRKSISYGKAYCAGALLEGCWKLLGRRDEPPMTRFLAGQLAKSHYYSLVAAERDLGYCAAITTAEGMERYAASLQ